MKPSKPSHALNLEAVKEWAKSLTPEDRVQWLDSLLERKGEQSQEPAAEQGQTLNLEQEPRPMPAYRPRMKKAQALKEHQAHALKQQTLELNLDKDTGGVIVAIETPPTPGRVAASGSSGRRQRWSWTWKRAQALEQAAEATETAGGGGAPKLLQEAAAQADLERLSQALAQALEQKGG